MAINITPAPIQIRGDLFPDYKQDEILCCIAEQRPLTELEQRIIDRIAVRKIAIQEASKWVLTLVTPGQTAFLLADHWSKLVDSIDKHFIRLCPEFECDSAFLPTLAENVQLYWGSEP